MKSQSQVSAELNHATIEDNTSTTTGEAIIAAEQAIEDLERRKQLIIKPFYEEYKAALELLAAASGGSYAWQDGAGTVYQLTEPDGRYVHFDRYAINRTRYSETAAEQTGVNAETRGSLSLTAAKELGYEVEGKTEK